MQSAIDNIKSTYDYETCKEIVDHGCQSGVCSEHIYYGDTIKFFDRYENEVIHWLTDQLGDDIIEEIWSRNPGHITGYKNEIVWSFIEMVAMSIVDAKEEQELNDEKIISEYQYDLVDRTLQATDGYNPEGSMTDSRYAQV